MAGLIAARVFPGATIQDGRSGFAPNHKAVLRFRTDRVEQITGIKLKRAVVDKAIYYGGKLYTRCNPSFGNQYSMKVVGRLERRSIWNLESELRYIPPSDFEARLYAPIANRVNWGADIESLANHLSGPMISTIPISALAMMIDFSVDEMERNMKGRKGTPIYVTRYRVGDCDVNQTIYFPGGGTSMYRATLTDGVLICEFAKVPAMFDEILPMLEVAFATGFGGASVIDETYNPNGKLTPLNEKFRKNFLFCLSHERGIYSLGRFATWRNILMDDVVQDAVLIRDMIASSAYDRALG